eukprot:11199656-Lingulodinium_polyedra.AAC.1
MSEGSIEKDTLWLLHRQGDEVLNRMLEMACGIEPKRSIKDTMDRRERVFRALTFHRHEFFGNVLKDYGKKLAEKVAMATPGSKKEKFPLNFPFYELGLFEKGFQEGEPIDENSKVTQLKHISGRMELTSVLHWCALAHHQA